MNRAEVIALICSKAEEHGLDRVEFLGGIIAEGLDVHAARPSRQEDWRRYWEPPEPLFDVSFGLGQKNARFSAEYKAWCAARGIPFELGGPADAYPGDDVIAMIRDAYFDPSHALDVAALEYRKWRYDPEIEPLHAWVSYNGPVYYREKPWRSSPALPNYADGLAEARAILSAAPIPTKEPVIVTASQYTVDDGPARFRSAPGTTSTIVKELATGTALYDVGGEPVERDGHSWRQVALGPVGWIAEELLAGAAPPATGGRTYNPDFPLQLQRQDWTCSIRTVMMMLASVGIFVTPEQAQDILSPKYVNSAVGLKDASAAGLVEALRENWGVAAVNFPSLSFDEAMSLAGTGAFGLGLRNWGGPQRGHWSAVRGKSGDRLVLANPGGTGPTYGQQTLNRQEYDARGPASGVWINPSAV